MPTKVAIAMDTHPVTRLAADWYLGNVAGDDHQVVFLHMSPSSAEPTATDIQKTVSELTAQHSLPDERFQVCVVPTSANKKEGIAKDLLAELNKISVDMVVLGCRYSQKSYLGSVSDYIIKNTSAVCLIKKLESVEDAAKAALA